MSEIWEEVPLGEIIENFDSKRVPLSTKERSTRKGDYPYYGASGIIDYIDDYIFDGSYLLISEDGENLNTRKTPIAFWAHGKFWVNNHAHIVKGIDGKALTDYIRYWFSQADISGYITGAAQPKLSQGNLNRILIKLPELREQERIVAFLSQYDDLIENNNRRIQILETIAQKLYQEWFVHYRFPNHQQAQWRETDQGKIPVGWEVKRLDDFIVLQRGFDLPKAKRNEGGSIPIYAASGINGFHNEVKATAPGLVTGRSGTLGVVNLVLEDFWPLNTSLWVKEFKGCTAYYAYYLLSSIELKRFNSGASVPTLNRNDIHGLEVIAPPDQLIEKFERLVTPLYALVKNLQLKNKNLKQQRDLLLPKLVKS